MIPEDDDGDAPGTPPLEAASGAPGWTQRKAHMLFPSALSEMAERHNTKHVLKLARDLVCKVQTLIENK